MPLGSVTAEDIALAKAVLREEFYRALAEKADLLVTAGVARHDKAILRIEAITESQRTFQENLNRVPTQLDRETQRLTELFTEKLHTIDVRTETFQAHDAAMRENARESIGAALAAAEKLTNNQRATFEQQISKSEASFTKEIDGLKALITATKDATTADIGNLTGRLDRGEGDFRGMRRAVGDRQASTTVNSQVIGQVIAFFVLALMIVGVFVSLHQSPSIGGDGQRLNDIIANRAAENQQRIAEQAARLDALSSRINGLVPALPSSTRP